MAENNLTDQNPSEIMEIKFQKSAESDLSKDSPQISPENLLTKLTEATKDLFYISETDAPFEAFIWQPESGAEVFSTVNAVDVLRFTGNTSETTFREQSLEDFFRSPTTEIDWQSDEEKEVVKRYVKLKELVETELRAPKIIKIGEVEIDVYIVGIETKGNLAGLKTQAVET